MTTNTIGRLLALALLLSVVQLPGTVAAQAQLSLGSSTQELLEWLRGQGYTDLRVTKEKFSRINVEACQNGVRYILKVRRNGRFRSKERIGTCRRNVDLDGARQILRNDGFRRIRLQQQGRRYVGTVCKQGNRFAVVMDRAGNIQRITPDGACQRQQALTPQQVTRQLRQDGYDRINFIDRNLPRYVAEACRGNDRLELEINRRGRINNERRIGRCQPPINPRDIASVLARQGFKNIKVLDSQLPKYVARGCKNNRLIDVELNRYGRIIGQNPKGACRRPIRPADLAAHLRKRGYDRIDVLDRTPPRYLVEACKGNDRLEMRIDKFGDIIDQLRLSNCRRPFSEPQLVKFLQKEGYRRINVRGQDGNDFIVRACRNKKRLRLRVSHFGDVKSRRPTGDCVGPSIDAIAKRLGDRGYRRITHFVEACRKGRLYIIKLDEFGTPIDRRRTGRCN
ncbi:MAG: hypothetical protein AAF441_01715 [Pseudomonadota bacterium]